MIDSMIYSLLALLVGAGGGRDLLEYVPPADYWQQQKVTVSVATMAKELKPVEVPDLGALIDGLNSPDAQAREEAASKIAAAGPAALPKLREAIHDAPPQVAAGARGIIARIESASHPAAVRRLMAIRTMGTLKDKEGLAALRPLLKSDEPFVAEYAQDAINRIEGRPVPSRVPAGIRDDVWLLPDACRAVGQAIPGMGSGEVRAVSIDQMLKGMSLPPGMNAAVIKRQMLQALIGAAEQVGNIRLDAITFGVSGDIGPQGGFFVFIARGRYDAHAAADLLRKQQGTTSAIVNGVEVFNGEGNTAVLFPSDEYAVGVISASAGAMPLADIVDATCKRQGKLKGVAEIKRLVDAVPADEPLWAVMKVTPAFAQATVLNGFDTVMLNTHREGTSSLRVTIEGTGAKPEQAKAVAEMINQGAKQAVPQIREEQKFMPALKSIGDALESVRCEPKGGNATMSMTIDDVQGNALMLPFMAMGRVEPADTQPAAPPAPAQ